ncbi:MAG: PDZ domain-containing protein [Chloroflexi bacterium]|nr:PDZ domain-containing protein [Chloroflexota bacterium]
MSRNKLAFFFGVALAGLVAACGLFGAGLATGMWYGRQQAAPLAPEATPFIPTPTPWPTRSASPAGEQPAPTAPVAPSPTPATLQELFRPFWEAWELVHELYVEQPVNDLELMRGAIRGMLQALGDPHTGYMTPEEFQDAQAPLEGEYEGIGAWVDITSDYLTIISPIPGSPAEKAGLRPGDKIIAVNGEDVTGVPPELVRRRVLGPAGEPVVLTIRRTLENGEVEEFDVTIVRAKITIVSVESTMMDNGVGYIRLITFGEKTPDELQKALEEILAQNPKGLILDLRNNGGGYLNTAVAVASQFLPPHTVVLYERYGNGTEEAYYTQGEPLALDVPLVVLVNEGTASASEIVAGALQDYERAPLVGEQTYGKGSVQQWIPLKSDGGAVRITVAYWLTPKKRLIHQQGLTPDYVVPLNEEDIEWLGYKPQPDKDPQLRKALEVLLQP